MGLFGAIVTSYLFAANPTTEVVNLAKGLFRDLNTAGPISLKYTPTITFSFVPPPSAETKEVKDNGRSQSVESSSPVRVWKPAPHEEIINEKDILEDEALLFQKIHDSSKDKPIAVYLPGLDGVGISATSQFDDLSKTFELWRLIVDVDDRSTFTDISNQVRRFIENVGANGREIVLIGESFGGVLAPNVLLQLKNRKSEMKPNVKGLVLVNPATSFEETRWSSIVPFLSSLRHLEENSSSIGEKRRFPSLYSILGGVTLATTIPDRTQLQWIADTIIRTKVTTTEELEQVLVAMRDGFGILEKHIPAETLEHRVTKWLPVATSVVNPRLSSITTPTIVIGGADDNMLPTKKESDRLTKVMPNCTKVQVTGAGHWVLDNRLNLTKIITESKTINPSFTRDPITEWEKPNADFIKRAINERVAPFRALTSPVFFSTNAKDGKRRRGLSNLPSAQKGPVLFVANHQFFGLDLSMIIAEILEQRNIHVRGLAHPLIFQEGGDFAGGGSLSGDYEGLFKRMGAVMVTPRNYYRLMETGQSALLFPGGVREVFHGKDEAYKLFWPEKVDFVRIAAKFNATVVPLSAVGAFESVNILIDAPDMLKLPFGIGENVANSSSAIMAARFDADNETELFAAPFALPKPLPARHYFVFGKPMSTANLDPRDKQGCDEFYQEVKKEMQRGFKDVIRAREKDPYVDTARRIVYETVTQKKAPTFSTEELNKD